MCGIAGICADNSSASPAVPEEILKIREAMRPRGPGGAGLWAAAEG